MTPNKTNDLNLSRAERASIDRTKIESLVVTNWPDLATLSALEVSTRASSVVNYLLTHGNTLPFEEVQRLVAEVQSECRYYGGMVHVFREHWSIPTANHPFKEIVELRIDRSLSDTDIVTGLQLLRYGLETDGESTLNQSIVTDAFTSYVQSRFSPGFNLVVRGGDTLSIPKALLHDIFIRASYDYHGRAVYERSFYAPVKVRLANNGLQVYLTQRDSSGSSFVSLLTSREQLVVHHNTYHEGAVGWSASFMLEDNAHIKIKNTDNTPLFIQVLHNRDE